jgi:hypothetical protein
MPPAALRNHQLNTEKPVSSNLKEGCIRFLVIELSEEIPMDLTRQSNEELISNTHGAIKNETEATINVVRHFKEIYERDLYLARGFSTMYLMAVEEFGYDSSSALRRTHALELALAVPSVLEKIDRGELCLQSVADIQTFLNRERGAKKIYSPEQKAELVNNCSGLSTRSVQAELAGRNSDVSFCETKKVISKNQIRVTYVTKIATEEKLDRIKSRKPVHVSRRASQFHGRENSRSNRSIKKN